MDRKEKRKIDFIKAYIAMFGVSKNFAEEMYDKSETDIYASWSTGIVEMR